MASSSQHLYSEQVLKMINLEDYGKTAIEYPILVVLAPKLPQESILSPTKQSKKRKRCLQLDVLGVVRLHGQDISADYLYKFLSSVLEIHGTRKEIMDAAFLSAEELKKNHEDGSKDSVMSTVEELDPLKDFIEENKSNENNIDNSIINYELDSIETESIDNEDTFD